MKKKALAAILAASLIFGSSTGTLSLVASAETYDVGEHTVNESEVPMRLYYDEEASHGVAEGYDDVDTYFGSGSALIEAHPNDDWERWSIPIGNGYYGANLFGRTETERIQLTEKTLANPYKIVSDTSINTKNVTDGLNNFSETYIDFGHPSSAVTDYSRELDLATAISTVKYNYNGVAYTREYFASYPDKAIVIKLDASETGALDFVLRPTVPYEQEYMYQAGDGGGKTGTVASYVSEGVGNVILSGTLEYFGIDFVGLYKVYSDGEVKATTCVNKDGDTDGTITVSGATSAYIVITMGTDYQLCPETFLNGRANKPTQTTTLADARQKVDGYMAEASSYSYDELKARHLADYASIYGRVSLDLDFEESDIALTTDELLKNYKNGSGSSYLEALYFQYGRYLLIASSRSGALPANLQGAWNRYNHTPWTAGYWHNINVQMNYWPAFSTNIAETFEAYVEYNKAYMPKAMQGATGAIASYNKDALGKDGGNGWSIDTGGYVNDVSGSTSIGNLGFTTQLFWEYFAYTQDETVLKETVYPVLVSAARYITKMVKKDADGNYIAIRTDSPEQYVNGVWYYTDKGAAYAQSFAYQNNYNLLLAAKELGINPDDSTHEDYAILNTVLEQIDHYDPIRVGLSGHVKEFFEENYYGELGEYTHRHISQLVGLYPGSVINGTTPAWMDAAKYTLTERGDKATGWGVAHRLNLWARVQDGERAYDLLEQLLKVNTATNLWDLHPPFQIDGNLGGTSGISEMLLQSHAGYVEPLAAIPAAWANGSYTGLVARGNFEVSAAWADGIATSFNIKSLKGGELSVKYSGIENATVTDSKGRAVDFTVSADDIVTFNTTAGETYYVWGFTAKITPKSVDNLKISTELLGASTISWDASSDARCYKVYVAKDNAPDYTLLTVTADTTFTYEGGNERMTFAVTAVGNDGSESKRSLVYRNPDDVSAPVLEISANVLDGNLQVAVKSNEYSEKYRLYSRENSSSAWVLVQESDYPIIIEKSYDKALQYGVSALNILGEESEIRKIASYNASVTDVVYNASNILAGTVFVPSAEGYSHKHSSATYGDYGKLTDGDFGVSTGRFSTSQTTNGVLEGTATLNGTFMLGELKIYDFLEGGNGSKADFVGNHLKVDVFCDGKWTTVKEYNSNADILALRKSDDNGKYIGVDLSLVRAQLIRVRFDTPINTTKLFTLSLNEIQLTGIRIGEGLKAVNNVLADYKFAATDPSAGSEWKPYAYLTDGKFGWTDPGRFATVSGKAADGTIDFEGKVFAIETLRLDYTAANLSGKDITIYVFRNGAWHEVLHKVYDAGVTSVTFELNGVEAERLRFYVSGQRADGNYIGISEISATGYEVIGATIGNANILLGTPKDKITVTGATLHASVPNVDYAFDGNLTTRYAVYDRAPYSYSLDIELDGAYRLGTMTFYPFFNRAGETSRSNDTKIEVYYNGVWSVAAEHFEIAAQSSCNVYLGDALATKIRITFNNTAGSQNATLYEIMCSGVSLADTNSSENTDSNVFEGTSEDQVTIEGTRIHHDPRFNDVKYLFDGKLDTRLAVVDATPYAYSLTVDLEGKYSLYTMRIYAFRESNESYARSNDTTVDVYLDGTWFRVTESFILEAKQYTEIYLNGVSAEKVRINFKNTSGTSNASIYELTCTVGAVAAIDREPLLDAYKSAEAVNLSGLGLNEIKNAKLKSLREILMDTQADQEKLDAYTALITSVVAELEANNLVTETHGKFTSHNLSLTDEVSVHLYGSFTDCDGATVLLKVGEEKIKRISLGDLNKDNEGRFVLTVDLPAARMTEEITVSVLFADGTCTEDIVTSVRKYAETIIANPAYEEQYPGINSLVTAMLNYGAYAQKYFGINTENLANEGYEYDLASEDFSKVRNEEPRIEGALLGIAPAGYSLALASDITIKFYFKSANVGKYQFFVTDPYGEVKYVNAQHYEGDVYYVAIPVTDAYLLESDYTVTVLPFGSEETLTVKISAMDYIDTTIVSASSEALRNVAKMMKVYARFAKEYYMASHDR